jgi:hypothetical protein
MTVFLVELGAAGTNSFVGWLDNVEAAENRVIV